MMWKEKYRINVSYIDDQHEELFKRVSDFLQVVQSKDPWEKKVEKVKDTMAFMKDYVESHFADEEVYQEQIQYPDIEKHREAHAKFKAGIYDYVKIFESQGYTKEIIQEFGGKLMTWLIMHVGKMDQKIGEYVRSKEAQSQ